MDRAEVRIARAAVDLKIPPGVVMVLGMVRYHYFIPSERAWMEVGYGSDHPG
jgi:hypothetical protein